MTELHQHTFEDEDGTPIACPICGTTRSEYTNQVRAEAQKRMDGNRYAEPPLRHYHHFKHEDGDRCDCGLSLAQYETEAAVSQALGAGMVKGDSEYVEQLRKSATMDGIDNSWNLLHIATAMLPVCVHPDPATAAKRALQYADALLKEFRKSQGELYGEEKAD